MKPAIRKGSLVRRTGDTAIGTVVFLDATHAGVDYRYDEGAFKTGYIPLALLELVSVGVSNKANCPADSRAAP
jgi:hypothetical protein